MTTAGKPHYLPHNKAVWSPPTVVFVKTVTAVLPGSDPETLVMTGWLVTAICRRDITTKGWEIRNGSGSTPLGLAEWIDENTKGRPTVWLFTHDATLDLITTRLPLELHYRGWSINDASLSGKAPWLRLGRGKRRICIVSSYSYLPYGPSDLRDRAGWPELKRGDLETDQAWSQRSADYDLTTVTDMMIDLLDWWDKHALGKWSVSGPSTGFHAMRHLPNPHKVVIDPDPARIAADRRAIHGGRRGAWLVGTRSLGPFLELDFTNAYPSVARNLPLPAKRGAAFSSLPLDNWRLTSERWGIIADVELQTNVSRWPVRFSGGTFCPTGRFHTTLCGPEIRDALRLGCLISVGPGITHQLGWHLAAWGEWIIDTAHNADGGTPVAAQIAAKSWSRSTIGKFAARGYKQVELGPSPHQGWSYEEGWDHDSQARFGTIHMAGETWQSVVDGDSDQAYPGVFAWVESETRVRLTRVIEAIGERAVIQCDTDGLIVSERIIGTRAAKGHLLAPGDLVGAARTKWVLDQLDPIIAPLAIRIKGKHSRVTVLGPQHVRVPGERRFAGVPTLATEGQPDRFTFRSWPGLAYQLQHGPDGGYVRPERSVSVRGPYAPGWVLTDGRVIPPQCEIRADGTNRMLAWHDTTMRPRGARLAAEQHPALSALW